MVLVAGGVRVGTAQHRAPPPSCPTRRPTAEGEAQGLTMIAFALCSMRSVRKHALHERAAFGDVLLSAPEAECQCATARSSQADGGAGMATAVPLGPHPVPKTMQGK